MKKLIIYIAFLLLFQIPSYYTNEIVVDGGNIQDAINESKEGDIIVIKAGVYYENLIINKSIVVLGEGKVIVDGKGKTALKINAKAIVKNIEFRNSSKEIAKVNDAFLENCSFYNGKFGIIANNSSIIDCKIYECGGGALLFNKNLMRNCIVYKCGLGIEIRGGENFVEKCRAHTCGVAIHLENASQNVIEKCDIYKNNNNQGGIFLINSNSNLIKNCNLSFGSFGVRMLNSNENKITRCNIFRNRYGVKMEDCKNNEIKYCLISNNRFGITLEECSGIEINYNDIVKSHLYSLDAKFSKCDARHNYWGALMPKKLHKIASLVKTMPWLIKPLYGKEIEGVSCYINSNSCNESADRNYAFINQNKLFSLNIDDFDPLVDIKVGVKIKRARSFEGDRLKLKIFIDGKKNITYFEGDEWLNFTAWQDVDDAKQIVTVELKIGKEEKSIFYDLATGNWYGDDKLYDNDGYGHIKFKNAELWFDIIYNDFDGDGLNYWEEVFIYQTMPNVSDYGKDYDKDGLPIQWEDKYGFSDFVKENHTIDYDKDGLNDYEEYLTSSLLSDPFAKDIFVEVDYMKGYELYEESIQMIYNAFAKHNITMHILLDEEIPYKERTYYRDARDFYWKYFLHENVSNPKHGIFHYVILVAYSSSKRGGHAFVGWDNLDSFLLAGEYINKWRLGKERKIAYASLFMHELGHTLGLFDDTFEGIDNESCNYPWLKGYWKYSNYKSCLNYRYAFEIADYSDGSHGRNDFNDWANLDLTFFKNSSYYKGN